MGCSLWRHRIWWLTGWNSNLECHFYRLWLSHQGQAHGLWNLGYCYGIDDSNRGSPEILFKAPLWAQIPAWRLPCCILLCEYLDKDEKTSTNRKKVLNVANTVLCIYGRKYITTLSKIWIRYWQEMAVSGNGLGRDTWKVSPDTVTDFLMVSTFERLEAVKPRAPFWNHALTIQIPSSYI